MCLAIAYSRDKNDGSVLGTGSLPDEERRFKPVHDRHVHVKKNDRKLALEQTAQRLGARGNADHILSEVGQDCLHGQAFVVPVIDQKDADLALVSRGRAVLNWTGGGGASLVIRLDSIGRGHGSRFSGTTKF